jgi:hypothetical protein
MKVDLTLSSRWIDDAELPCPVKYLLYHANVLFLYDSENASVSRLGELSPLLLRKIIVENADFTSRREFIYGIDLQTLPVWEDIHFFTLIIAMSLAKVNFGHDLQN